MQSRQSESAGEKVWLHWRGKVPKNTTYKNTVSGIYKTHCMEYCIGFCQSFMFWLKPCQIFWLKNTKEKTVQTIHFITKRLMRCLFLAKAQQDIYKCHLPCSRLMTFIFININPEDPNDDTGTAVWGSVPSWALQAPFLWPLKATVWGDAHSLICAARLVPERHFMRQRRA